MATIIMNHALIEHKLSIMRDKNTPSYLFKQNLDDIAQLMVYEVTKNLPLKDKEVVTPICATTGKQLAQDIILVPILRAGLGLLDGFRNMIKEVKVGFLGMARDEETLIPHEYYAKLPKNLDKAKVIIIDPMLATGGSSVDALDNIKAKGAKDIVLACLIAAPEGVKLVEEKHPDIDIYIAHLDDHLNEKGYIVPGLGDAGDRLFGTDES